MALRAGELHEKIVVQNNTPSANGYGEPIASWGTYATRRAAVDPISGTERWIGDQRLAEMDYRFRIRYDSTTKSITPTMRVSYASKFYNIEQVINVGTRDREIHLYCREVVA